MVIVPDGKGGFNVEHHGRIEVRGMISFQAAQAWVKENAFDWPPNWDRLRKGQK